APLRQAVFNTLKGRAFSEHAELVSLPTKAQYESIAQLLGQSLGQLGQVDNQTLDVIAEMLSLDATAVFNDSGEVNDLTKKALSETVCNIGEIEDEGVLTYQVRNPAKAFLRTQKVHVVQGEEAMAHQEPLFLDNLTTYQIKENLITELATNEPINITDGPAPQNGQILWIKKRIPPARAGK